MRAISLMLLALCCSLAVGCGSIVRGPNQVIQINSVPSQATVKVLDRDGKVLQKGVTPCSLSLGRSSGYFQPAKYTLVIQKPGFPETRTDLRSGLNGWFWGNFGFFGFFPVGMFIVDPLTGGMFSFADNAATADLATGKVRAGPVVAVDPDQPAPTTGATRIADTLADTSDADDLPVATPRPPLPPISPDSKDAVVIQAHQGAWIESIDGVAQPRPGFALADPGNKALVASGKRILAIRTEPDQSKSGMGSGVSISFDSPSQARLNRFEYDLKPGHTYEIMSAGKFTCRLEIFDKTDRVLQYYDWGSDKLIADKSPDKKVKDYLPPKTTPDQCAMVRGIGGTNVTTVDGTHVSGSSVVLANAGGNTVLLTPGRHRIAVSHCSQGMTSVNTQEVFIKAFRAGHTYEVGPSGGIGAAIELIDVPVK